MRHRHFYTCLLTLLSICATAQITVEPMVDVISSEADLYHLEINNPSGDPVILLLEIDVREDNQLVYQSRTNQYSLLAPIATLSQAQLQPTQVLLNTVKSWTGKYQVGIRIIDHSTQQVIYVDRYALSGSDESGNDTEQSRLDLDFQFGGTARLYGQLSSMQGVGSVTPQNYGRAEIHPDMALYGIPIGADILLSTEQNQNKQSINQFALRFDAQQFKRQMQRRLYAKVKEIDAIGDLTDVKSLDDLKAKAMDKKFPKLQEWEAQLKDPKIQQALQDLKQLESIDQVLKSPEVKKALTDKTKLEVKKQLTKADIDELDRLKAFAKEIEKLQAKADQIRALSEQYEQYKDIGQKVKQAKRYANKDIIRDPSFLKNGVKSLDILSKPQELLSGFDAITIGTSYPYYSRFSLNGLSINGIHVEWNPGKIFLATSYGKSSRRTLNTAFANPLLTLPQNTLAIKAGYGSPHSTHVHLAYFDIKDKFEDVALENITNAQQNKIVGITGQLDLFGGNLLVGGEVMGSLLTRDHTIETDETQEFKSSDIPLHWLYGNVNNASSYDIAWKLEAEARVLGNNTKVKGAVERIGANYHSLGSPTLLNDMLRWRVDVQQSLWDNKIRITAYARQDDNYINNVYANGSNTTRMFGFSAALNIKKIPMLYMSYSPYAQNSDLLSQGESLDTKANILNANISYPYTISTNLSGLTQLTYLYQDLESNIEGLNHDLIQYGFTQSITYQRSSLSANLSYAPNQIIVDESQEVLTANISVTSQLFKKLQLTGGYQYLTIRETENRTGFFVDGRYPLSSWADIELRVQRNMFNASFDANQNYRDIIAWGGVNFRW